MKLQVASYHKLSFNNSPTDFCSVVFLAGCNLKCPYCHNPWLLKKQQPDLRKEFLDFLSKKQDVIDSVVISGGEPTLQPELGYFIKQIRGSTTKIKIKLDTNGTKPDVLSFLIKSELVDYIAMDVKGPLSFYKDKLGLKKNAICILDSIQVIKDSGIKHEFRVTVADPFIGPDELIDILNLAGEENLILQPYKNSGSVLDPKFDEENSPPTEDYLNNLNRACESNVCIRGFSSETEKKDGKIS